MNAKIKPIILACALSSLAGPAMALTDTYLIAKEFTKTLPGGTQVTMWGYALDVDGLCYGTTPIADRRTSPDCLDPVATAPGPEIVLPPGETDARIFLTNLLPVPSSVFMTGQKRPFSNLTSNGPTWNDGSVGSRTSATQKMRSYGREAGPNGGRRAYVWRPNRATAIDNEGGTFIYYSGTEPQKQMYMGLYGAVTKTAAAGEIYTGVPYVNEQILFYSDIDPAHNAAVAAGDPNYTPIDYQASWFLVNGEPYTAGSLPTPMGMASEPTLLRFLSVSSEKHVPVIQGMHGSIHAEDGIPYNWQDSATGTVTPAPIEQYSVDLPPLKTKDVIIAAPAEGTYAVYDGNGYMTNPSDPENPDIGDEIGGMLTFLSFEPVPNQPPVATPDELTVVFAPGALPGSGYTGLVNVLANDSDPEGGNVVLIDWDSTSTIGGGVSCNNTQGDAGEGECTFTPDAYVDGATGTFSYTVRDDVDLTASAQVTLTLAENQAPVPVDDTVSTDDGVAADFNVLANDTDSETDPLQMVTLDTAGIVEGLLLCNSGTGDCTYTPPAASTASVYPLVETFTYTLTDGFTLETATSASVTITVNAPVVAPVFEAAPDGYTMDQDTVLSVDALSGVLSNDTFSNATTEAQLVTGPLNDPAFVLNPDGSFTYTPTTGFSGDDSFTYHLNDAGTLSADVLVTITVSAPAAAAN